MKKFKRKSVIKNMLTMCICSYQKEDPLTEPSSELIKKWKKKLEALSDDELVSLFTQNMLDENVLKNFIK